MIGPRGTHASRMIRLRQAQARPQIELFSFERVTLVAMGVVLTVAAIGLGMIER